MHRPSGYRQAVVRIKARRLEGKSGGHPQHIEIGKVEELGIEIGPKWTINAAHQNSPKA